MKLNKKVISFLLSAILITTSVALPVSANDDTSTDYSCDVELSFIFGTPQKTVLIFDISHKYINMQKL